MKVPTVAVSIVSAVSILFFGNKMKQIYSIQLQYKYGWNTHNCCLNIRGIFEQKYTKDADTTALHMYMYVRITSYTSDDKNG